MMPSREDFIADNVEYYVRTIRLYVYRLIALGIKSDIVADYLNKLSSELFAGDLPSSLPVAPNMDPLAARPPQSDTKQPET